MIQYDRSGVPVETRSRCHVEKGMRTSNKQLHKAEIDLCIRLPGETHITCKKHLSQHVFPKSDVELDDPNKPESAKTHSWAE